MKRPLPLKWAFLALSLCAITATQAETYTVKPYGLTGGGGISSNGGYTVSGTIAEPITEPVSGGGFTFAPGFLNASAAIELGDGPVYLAITGHDGSIIISWSAAASAALILEVTTNIADPASWQPASETPVVAGPDKTVTIPLNNGHKFYRLRQSP